MAKFIAPCCQEPIAVDHYYHHLKIDPLSDESFFQGRITQQRRLLASQVAHNGHHLTAALAFSSFVIFLANT